jgi:hypothetical protein
MENPRTRSPGEWAPPPAVVVPVAPVPRKPAPAPKRAEEEFEATLGSLVEHFNTLPPPAFGEPPTLQLATPEDEPASEPRGSRRVPLWLWGAGSLLLGAVVVGGLVLGLGLWRPPADNAVAPAPVVAATPAPRPEPPQPQIVVKSLPEDRTEGAAPTTEPLPEPRPEERAAAAEESGTARKVRKSTLRRSTLRKRGPARPRPSAPSLPAAAGEDSSWADPYR